MKINEHNVGGQVARNWARRTRVIGGFILLSTAWAANAAAEKNRADFDLDDDGLIEINDLGDLDEIRNSPAGLSLYGKSDGCPAAGCSGFELTTDLDFDTSGDEFVDEQDDYFLPNYGWIPIEELNATFEGNDHTISRLRILGATYFADPQGLFARAVASLVQNVHFEDVNFRGFNSETGVLAGQFYDGSIANVTVVGADMFTDNASHVGGLVGTCGWSEIKESYTSIDLRASDRVGGLVGESFECVIHRSFALGRVTSDRYNTDIGGLVGHMISGSINDAYATASVGEGAFFGGLVGSSEGTPVVENAFVSGAVVGTGEAGGALLGFGPVTFTSTFYATDTTGYTKARTGAGDAGAVGVTLADLRCPDAPNDPDCLPGLFAGWQSVLNDDGQPAWDFGTNQQVPALRLRGVVRRDSDGDGVFDPDDEFPYNWAASVDTDGDGAIDFWREGCDEACRAGSGLVLDQFPMNAAAAVDLDLDGLPDAWNAGCNFACRAGSGLTLDTSLDDLDNDGIEDAIDQDDNGDGVPDVDLDSDNLIDLRTLEQFDRVRLDPTGVSLRSSLEISDFADVEDASGCRPRIVGPIVRKEGVVLFPGGVLARLCDGYELLNDLDFDTDGIGGIGPGDDYWNDGLGWKPLGHFGDDPRLAFQTNFEGNGHVIRDLFVDRRGDTNEMALFGGVRGANIRNLGLTGDNMSVTGDMSVGALAAVATTTTVSNCYSTGPVVSVGGISAGGLIGDARGIDAIGSFATADVVATGTVCNSSRCDALGGLVGRLTYDATVTASFASGAAVADGAATGGLVGRVDTGSVVTGSFSTGYVEGVPSTYGGEGGLIGWSDSDAVSSYWATDSSMESTSAGNAQGATMAELQCPVGADDTTCVSAVTLYADWNDYVDPDDEPYWDFGTASELPGLCLGGTLYRVDSSGALLPESPCMCEEVDTELVTNQGFESNTSGWVGSYQTNISSSTQQAHSGARSLRIANRNIGTWQGAEYNLLSQGVPGETLDASLWARISGDPSEPALLTLRSTCQGSATAYTTIASATATNTGWTQLNGSFEVPSCTLTELVVYAEGPRTGVVLYIDDASIARTTLVCAGDEAPLAGQFLVQTDWGTGYCVELIATNPTALPTVDWSATFNLNGATIYDMWNLTRTSSTGSPTVFPTMSQVLDPGARSYSLGFCANRPSGNSALPSGLVVTGSF
jgi:hypothetical protein